MNNWYVTSQQDLNPSDPLSDEVDDLDEDLDEDLEEEDFEDDSIIDSEPFEANCYHGSVIQPNEKIFTEISTQYSSYDAIWVTTDENIAKEFATRFESTSTPESENIPVVFRCFVHLDNCIQIYDKDTWSEIAEMYGFSPNYMADAISNLKTMGYDGWKTIGDINGMTYDDISSFYEGKVQITGLKIMTPEGWSAFVDLTTGNQMIEQLRNFSVNPESLPEPT